jgi:hypothetical protein
MTDPYRVDTPLKTRVQENYYKLIILDSNLIGITKIGFRRLWGRLQIYLTFFVDLLKKFDKISSYPFFNSGEIEKNVHPPELHFL